MDTKTQLLFDARARIIKAMAHPTRLFIIHQLSERERCVCELQKMVGADISTVSKHLAVLRNAGVVQDEKRGLQVFYRLRCPCIMDFFGCVETVLAENAKDQLNLVRS
jgi:ArsR family transcriptional regulator